MNGRLHIIGNIYNPLRSKTLETSSGAAAIALQVLHTVHGFYEASAMSLRLLFQPFYFFGFHTVWGPTRCQHRQIDSTISKQALPYNRKNEKTSLPFNPTSTTIGTRCALLYNHILKICSRQSSVVKKALTINVSH